MTTFFENCQFAVRMAGVGIVTGPMFHYFYKFLDSRKFIGNGNNKMKYNNEIISGPHHIQVFKRLAVDTASIPFFSFTFMMSKLNHEEQHEKSSTLVSSLYEGKRLQDATHEYKSKMWHIWKVKIQDIHSESFRNLKFRSNFQYGLHHSS